jgi:membrane-associated phospholipid phosphatase
MSLSVVRAFVLFSVVVMQVTGLGHHHSSSRLLSKTNSLIRHETKSEVSHSLLRLRGGLPSSETMLATAMGGALGAFSRALFQVNFSENL